MAQYEVMTDGLVHSRHDTMEQAQAEIAQAKKDAIARAAELQEEIDEILDYANGLRIKLP